jgi:cyanophycinase
MNYWAGTEVQSIMQSKLANVTVGGTSAGLAVLGNWVYTAEKGSVTSDEALANPYDRYMEKLVAPLLKIPFMGSIVTDTHFGPCLPPSRPCLTRPRQ